MKKDGDESLSIRPKFKGNSPLALEVKQSLAKKVEKPKPTPPKRKSSSKKQIIFESDIKGNSLLDESQIRE